MDTFRVYARCRPLNQTEIAYGAWKKAVNIIDESTIYLSDGISKQHTFQLDGVYNENATNFDIFSQSVVPLIENVLNGINSTAFAYGITGAGKSFTMFGKFNRSEEYMNNFDELAGIIPLTIKYLLDLTAQQPETKLRISYIEIYNEQVYDLFQSHQQNLQLSEDPIQGVIVQDLTELELSSFEQVQELIAVGNSRRVIAQTKANQVSSRSHAIVIINLERKIENSDQYYTAKLSLVDLAGSEKQSVHHQTRGIRTFEGSNINRSLLTLGNCINMLSQKRKNGQSGQQFIPYRDSKLTRLLKDSLGGNTKTVMIACISPSYLCYEQTANTLKYACRANKIEKVVHANIKQTKNVEEYKKEIANLKKQNQLLKMNLNMSLMIPGLSAGFTEQQSKIKKNKVNEFLEKLTQKIEERVQLMARKNNENFDKFENLREMMKVQEEIKLSILSEFDLNVQQKTHNKPNVLKLQRVFSEKSQTSQIQSLISKKSQRSNISQNIKAFNNSNHLKPKKIVEAAQPYVNQNSHNQRNHAKSTYNQYKLSLKEEMKDPQYDQIVNNLNLDTKIKSAGNISSSITYPLINLENLRKKVMEDKKQFTNFKEQIKSGMLTPEQIKTKAQKLLQLEQSSVLRFSQDEKQYLIKLTQGEYADPYDQFYHNGKLSSGNKRRQSIGRNILSNGQFVLNILQQNGVQHSRNRHLQSLNRILMIKMKNNPHYQSSSNKAKLSNYTTNKSIIDNNFNKSLKQQINHQQQIYNPNYNSVHQQLIYHNKNSKMNNNYMGNLNGIQTDTYRNTFDGQNQYEGDGNEDKIYMEIQLPESYREDEGIFEQNRLHYRNKYHQRDVYEGQEDEIF